MKLAVPSSRLIEKRSDEQDTVSLVNQIRDTIINAKAEAFRLVSTTDATLTEIWSDDMNADSIAALWLVAVGYTAGAAQVGTYVRRVTARRIGSGTVAIIGAGADIIGTDHESVAGWDAGFALDAAQPGKIFATVTGAAATDISWRAWVTALVAPWE